MTPPEHTYFLGLIDYEWSAVGSLATAVAAVIALLLPIALEIRSRRHASKRELRRTQNIVDSGYAGLGTLADGLVAWCEKNPWELHDQQSWSIGIAKRLDIYSRDATLADDVLDCCVSISSCLALFGEVTQGVMLEVLSQKRTREAHTAMTIAIHAKASLERICARHGLNSRHRAGADESMERARLAMNKIPLDRTVETDF